MDAPVVQIVLNADISKGNTGVSAILMNKGKEPIYIHESAIPKSKHLSSDWGQLFCSGVKVKYNGLRYNIQGKIT